MKLSIAFIKKNTLFLLLVAQCALSLPLKAMEMPEESQKLELNNLPEEVLFKIAINVVPKTITSADQLLEIFRNLTKLMATNKRFYDLIQSQYFLDMLENKLSKKIGSGRNTIIWTVLERLKGSGTSNESFVKVLNGVLSQLSALAIVIVAIRNNDIKAVEKFLPKVKRRNFTIAERYDYYNPGSDLLTKSKIVQIPALIYAIQRAKIEIIELLLKHGANVNSYFKSSDGIILTPLLAAVRGPLDIIELLLKHGANIEAKDERGNTPLIHAAGISFADTVALLIKYGANIEARNNRGFTPLLHEPSRYEDHVSQIETLLVLLKHKANVDAQTNTGKTTLMCAVKENGQTQLVGWLLRYGASIELKDNKGRTALSMAQERGYTDIIEMLNKKQK